MTEHRLIVAGGRDFDNYTLLSSNLNQFVQHLAPGETIAVVSGVARGADALGAAFARQQGIRLYEFPADWDQYGKRAGYMRNAQMGDFSHGLIAFWDGTSRGTAHMIQYMTKLDKPITVIGY